MADFQETPDDPPELTCPQCRELIREAERLNAKMRLANTLILAAYQSGHREGWEPGPSVQETMDRLHDWIRNEEISEGAQPDPWARINKLRAENQRLRAALVRLVNAIVYFDALDDAKKVLWPNPVRAEEAK